MIKNLFLDSETNKASHSQYFYGLMMAILLFSPNLISTAYAQNISLEVDNSAGLTNDSVTFREVIISDNGMTETITTYEESYIYTDTVTRYIPDQNFTAVPNKAIATYGSFRVISSDRAEMVGTTDSYSMDRFNQMMAAYPSVQQIDMVDVAGTVDDEVNLALAAKINALGIATHIPQNGSVRSGGVELFLAGKKRTAHPSANFAVHSWIDEDGLEPHDYDADHPVHKSYIDYYRSIAGMSNKQAQDFYWMTNSAPHDSFINLTKSDIAKYVPVG